MDKAIVLSILAAYNPPLSVAQMDAIAEDIVQASKAEAAPSVEVLVAQPKEQEEDFAPRMRISGKSTRGDRRLLSQV